MHILYNVKYAILNVLINNIKIYMENNDDMMKKDNMDSKEGSKCKGEGEKCEGKKCEGDKAM